MEHTGDVGRKIGNTGLEGVYTVSVGEVVCSVPSVVLKSLNQTNRHTYLEYIVVSGVAGVEPA